MILTLTTGGTIDKVYFDAKSAYAVGEPQVTAILREAAAARFYALTPGRQRSLAHYATSAKRVETQITRALELARKLRTNTLYGDAERER